MAQLNDLLVMGQSTLLGPVNIQDALTINNISILPNNISTHGGLRISGIQNNYHGILLGDAVSAMTVMS